MKKVLVCVLTMLSVGVYAEGKLLKRVIQQADGVQKAFSESWEDFFGVGKYKNLFVASLDVRPDSTPNIVIDKSSGRMIMTIRLAANTERLTQWLKGVKKRFSDLQMSTQFSRFEDTGSVMIGGQEILLGENEKEALKRLLSNESNMAKSALSVKVNILSAKGDVVNTRFVPLDEFSSVPLSFDALNGVDACAKIEYAVNETDVVLFDKVVCEVLEKGDAVKYEAKEKAKRAAEVRKIQGEAKRSAVCSICHKKDAFGELDETSNAWHCRECAAKKHKSPEEAASIDDILNGE